MKDPRTQMMEDINTELTNKFEKVNNNLATTIVFALFAPLMTWLTIYEYIPPVFEDLLIARTALITAFSLMPIYMLANAKGDESVKEFLSSKSAQTVEITWADRLPNICSAIITICCAIVTYQTNIEIAILLIFNMCYAKFSVYISKASTQAVIDS